MAKVGDIIESLLGEVGYGTPPRARVTEIGEGVWWGEEGAVEAIYLADEEAGILDSPGIWLADEYKVVKDN